jgi:serine protease Do
MMIAGRSFAILAFTATALMMAVPDASRAQAVPRAGAPASFADMVESLSPAVVNIRTETRLAEALPQFPPGSVLERFNDQLRGPANAERSLGSGFIIDPKGVIVTNNHVIEDADAIEVALSNGETFAAEIVGRDPATDLAVLRVTAPKPLPSVKFGPSQLRRAGDWVVAIGNPYGLGNSVSVGVISARNRDISAGTFDDFIQTDAAINSGNSGGPLFDMEGRVIGVNSSILSPDGGNIGISFAIPSELTQDVVAQLLEFGETRRGWLGLRTQAVDLNIARAYGLNEAGGALVVRVEPGSPAAKAGVLEGDLITSFGKTSVESDRVLTRLSAAARVGSNVELELIRKAKPLRFSVTIARRPERLDQPVTPSQDGPIARGSVDSSLGIAVGPLSEAERRRYRIGPQIAGVLVLSVSPASAAFGKVQVGDVVEEVAFTPVANTQDFATAVRVASARGGGVLLKLRRRGDLYFESVPVGR